MIYLLNKFLLMSNKGQCLTLNIVLVSLFFAFLMNLKCEINVATQLNTI